MKETLAYKLLRNRKDGSIGPLFINQRQRIPLNHWLVAEDHPTKGYMHRMGWHCMAKPCAPHLTMKGRTWYKVMIKDFVEYKRPLLQGGLWFLAQHMKVIKSLNKGDIGRVIKCKK